MAQSSPTFLDWLKRQKSRNDAVGDLARDATRDPDFPRRRPAREIYVSYLEEHVSNPNVITAFQQAWKEY